MNVDVASGIPVQGIVSSGVFPRGLSPHRVNSHQGSSRSRNCRIVPFTVQIYFHVVHVGFPVDLRDWIMIQ